LFQTFATLQHLKKDPSIIISNADKGNITTILDKEWYDNNMNKMLDDQETYKHRKTTQPHPQLTMSINLLTTCSEAKTKRSKKSKLQVEKLRFHNTRAVRAT